MNTLTTIEKNMKSLWEEVLSINNIKMEDNFFDLGGNSLTAVILLEKIQENFKCNVDIADLINCESLRDVSNVVTNKLSAE